LSGLDRALNDSLISSPPRHNECLERDTSKHSQRASGSPFSTSFYEQFESEPGSWWIQQRGALRRWFVLLAAPSTARTLVLPAPGAPRGYVAALSSRLPAQPIGSHRFPSPIGTTFRWAFLTSVEALRFPIGTAFRWAFRPHTRLGLAPKMHGTAVCLQPCSRPRSAYVM